MLSDEERKAVENLKTEYEKLIKEDNILFPLYKSDAKRLINIIEKQSKEIEELKDKNNKLMEELDLTTVYISGVYDGEKKVQDKIKAKIEELEKGNKNTFIRGEKILVLQSLLEKE